jgi:hypothetical protein
LQVSAEQLNVKVAVGGAFGVVLSMTKLLVAGLEILPAWSVRTADSVYVSSG